MWVFIHIWFRFSLLLSEFVCLHMFSQILVSAAVTIISTNWFFMCVCFPRWWSEGRSGATLPPRARSPAPVPTSGRWSGSRGLTSSPWLQPRRYTHMHTCAHMALADVDIFLRLTAGVCLCVRNRMRVKLCVFLSLRLYLCVSLSRISFPLIPFLFFFSIYQLTNPSSSSLYSRRVAGPRVTATGPNWALNTTRPLTANSRWRPNFAPTQAATPPQG